MGSKYVLGTTCFLFLVAFSLKTNAADFDIKKYGAKADGKTDDSQVMKFPYVHISELVLVIIDCTINLVPHIQTVRQT